MNLADRYALAEAFRRKTVRLMEQNRAAFDRVLQRHREWQAARFRRLKSGAPDA